MAETTVDFNATEVFDLARRMEEGGGAFYRAAADRFGEPAVRDLLRRLASMEDGHHAIFGKLKECYLRKAPPVDGECGAPLSDYLGSWVRGYVYASEKKPVERLAGMTELAEVLRLAMELEKDAIAYYSGLRDMVREEDRWVVNRIIDHELMHLTTLGRVLREGRPPEAIDAAVPEFTCEA
jgi:rubrerythrin